MRVEYHPSVEQDVAEALRRCDATSQLLDEEFKAKLRRVIAGRWLDSAIFWRRKGATATTDGSEGKAEASRRS